MSKFLRQTISLIVAVLVLFGAVGITMVMSSQGKGPQKKQGGPQAAAGALIPMVEAVTVKKEALPEIVDVQGRLVAFNKIDVFAEVTGALKSSSHPFKEGARFGKGDVLLEIDQEEARLSLLSQKSNLLNAITQFMPDLKIDYPESFPQWKAYLNQFDERKPLTSFPEPLNEQEKLFIASKNVLSQFYTIRSAEARLKKYTVYAPFAGVVTESLINVGAVVRAGQKVGTLMNTSNFELEATMPLKELKLIRPGQRARLYSEDFDTEWNGTVKRINDQIDPNTQSATIYISVNGSGLKAGMYLKGEVQAGTIEDVLEIDRDYLVDQSKVYVINDSVLALTPVEVVKMNPNTVVVRGLEEGTVLLAQRIPGAYEGMKVQQSK